MTDSFLNDEFTPSETEKIVKVVGNRGDNTFEVQFGSGDKALARMPKKFNKVIWVKTGDFVVIEADTSEVVESKDGKEQFSINHILNKQNVKFLKNQGLWPVGLDGSDSVNDRKSGSVVVQDDLLMPEYGEEDEEGEEEGEEEEEEVLVDKMGNTIPK